MARSALIKTLAARPMLRIADVVQTICAERAEGPAMHAPQDGHFQVLSSAFLNFSS